MTDREFWTILYRALAMALSAIKARHLEAEPEPEKEAPKEIKRIARPG